MGEFTIVFKEDDLEARTIRAADVDGATVLVSISEDGRVCDIANACTHRGGPLDEGEREGNVVACP